MTTRPPTAATLARVRADIDTLRAEASEHTRAATTLGDQLTAPEGHLAAMARRETDLTQREQELAAELERVRAELQALRLEMVDTRRQVDGLTAERDAHLRTAGQAAAAADFYEGTVLPRMVELLQETPPHAALADTGLMVEPPKVVPRDEIEIVPPICQLCGEIIALGGNGWHHTLGAADHPATPAPDDPDTGPFNVVPASPETVAAVLGSAVTMPDVGAHPAPNPPGEPEPAEGPRHAKPGKRIDVTGAFKAIGDRITGSQDGDTDE